MISAPRSAFSLACVVALGVVPLDAREEAPNADALLKTARFVTTLQHQDLKGYIRKGETKFPVGLYLRGQDIQLSYTRPNKGQDIRFHMRLGENRYDLFELADGKTIRFPEEKLGEPIEKTDLSYEDLAMRFL